MINLYSQLLIMSFTAGWLYLILKFLSAVTLKHFTARWHYYTNIVVYMLFLLPCHKWISWLDLSFVKAHYNGTKLSSIARLNLSTVFSLTTKDIPILQEEIHIEGSACFKLLPYLLMVGTLIYLGIILIQNYSLNRRIFRICRLSDDIRILDALSKSKQQMDITKQIPVYISPCITTPFQYGIFKPCIVLPDIEFNTDELQSVFLHELTHWKRHDAWIKSLMLLTNAIHWFNPLAYMARFDIHRFCELSCDESVVKPMNIQERRRYCELMLNVLWNVADQNVKVFSAFSSKRKILEMRIDMILRNESSKSKRWIRVFAIVLTLAIVSLGVVSSGVMETFVLESKSISTKIAPDSEFIVEAISSNRERNDKSLEEQNLVSENLYPVNENGETYGPDIYSAPEGIEPDLVAATGIDGTDGYVRSTDLDPYSPRTPEEAVALNNLGDRIIPLYDKDGRTVIGQFRITSGRVEYITD